MEKLLLGAYADADSAYKALSITAVGAHQVMLQGDGGSSDALG